jgi:energy-coupling factor transporter ATP-binding protein EcfA2
MTSDAAEYVLEVKDLDYTYPGSVRALDQVSFRVPVGQRVAIVGPSGAGKSTLLLHLNGLLPRKPGTASDDATGRLQVCGLPVTRENLPEIRRRVGLVFQDPDDQLFCPTVREDVAFGPLNLKLHREEVERRVADSLAAVDLVGYENRSTLQLSVGERKRVCLAGVLACHPSVLALDEPTGNLDPRARRGLLELLGNSPVSQIIATHDLELVVEHCSRVLVLDQGRIRADGDPRAILADAQLMQRHGLEVPRWLLAGDA